MKPHFLPSILLFAIAAHAEEPQAGFSLKDQPAEHLDVLANGKTLARYMYAHDISTKESRTVTYKPYLHVFDKDGTAPITKGPGGLFPHHRGIFVGWNKMRVGGKDYDRWHMSGGDQVHREFVAQKADADGAGFTSRVEWMGNGEDPILEEKRVTTFYPAPAPAYAFIEVSTTLKAVGGETILGGDPEHAGLQYRPANEVKTKETKYVFPKENANPKKDRDYPWVGESYTLGDKRYSVVYLNHPGNPKDTAFSAYRDYGRFGGFFKADLAKDAELTIRCGFLIIEGEMPGAAWIQEHYNTYAGTSDPTPKTTVK